MQALSLKRVQGLHSKYGQLNHIRKSLQRNVGTLNCTFYQDRISFRIQLKQPFEELPIAVSSRKMAGYDFSIHEKDMVINLEGKNGQPEYTEKASFGMELLQHIYTSHQSSGFVAKVTCSLWDKTR